MSKGILVIGATLIDFIGYYQDDGSDVSNHAGNVEISIGGAAFNIASNISIRDAAECLLFSYCPPRTLSARVIKAACESVKLKTRWLSDSDDQNSEPAYVALLKDGSLERGVTSAPIERLSINGNVDLESAIKNCSLIATETNLTAGQLKIINSLATRYHKPICCMVVSDAKALRISASDFSKPFDLVSLNAKEAATLGFPMHEIEKSSLGEICDRLNASHVIVTDGENGYVVIDKAKSPRRFPAIEVRKVSDLGAGDALFAASCVSILKGEPLDGLASHDRISSWTASILTHQWANLATKEILTREIEETSVKDYWIKLTTCIAALAAALLTGHANKITFTLGFLASCVAGGVFGGMIRHAAGAASGHPSRSSRWVLITGTCIGILAAVVNAIPNLAAGDLPFQSAKPTGVNLIALSTFVSACIASLAFETALASFGAHPRSNTKEP